MTMKRWLAHFTIVAYLGALSFGLFAHTFKYKQSAHPAMYFVVWDMFWGWSAYALREHVVAEGASGKFYDVSSGPWGDFRPMGPLPRQHYDCSGLHFDRIAKNVLEQTDHEPIIRIYVVEEAWAKRFNMPESVWEARYGTPKEELYRYYHLWQVFLPDGTPTANNGNFLTHNATQAVLDNPRLLSDMQNRRPFFHLQPHSKPAEPDGAEDVADHPRSRKLAPSAN